LKQGGFASSEFDSIMQDEKEPSVQNDQQSLEGDKAKKEI